MKTFPQEICLDANIFVAALLLDEPHHEKALQVLQFVETNNLDIFEPAVVVYEVTSVLHQKFYLQELDELERDNGIEVFSCFPLLLQWQIPLLKKAVYFASQMRKKKIYDCSYLALASLRDIPLVTEDENLLKKGSKIHPLVFSSESFLKKYLGAHPKTQ